MNESMAGPGQTSAEAFQSSEENQQPGWCEGSSAARWNLSPAPAIYIVAFAR